MGTTLSQMYDGKMRNKEEEKKAKAEIKRRLKKMHKLMNEAGNILRSLPNSVHDAFIKGWSEDATVPHCLRWGVQSLEEALEDYKKFSNDFY